MTPSKTLRNYTTLTDVTTSVGGKIAVAKFRVRHLKGINYTDARLADGTKVRYWYAWRGGPRLIGEPGSSEFISSYEAAHAGTKQLRKDEFLWVIREFKNSRDFLDLAERTKLDYLKCIDHIEKEFSDMPLAALKDPRISKDFIDWRDKLKISPRWADYCLLTLFRIISWARTRGLTAYIPPARIKKLYSADRSDKIWLPNHIADFRRHAPDHVWLALVLAIETGQRQGDLLKLCWSSYDGQWINLTQSKTKTQLSIPATSDLKTILEGTKAKSPLILTTLQGRPWTESGFRTAWYRAAEKAGIEDLTFHDLRGTAVTRLAEAGCTEAEIASITGHSMQSVSSILRAYLAKTRGLALAAITKLERARG